ncbi:MAG TPA: ATP-binding cassette domain-containing protein [Stackebrandtia sp.]|jgi:putative ABC transport system ATP-binding protein|uniref:ABC transporter ATP-binding protein n=1 Tax=Stackebrandtia sp. TaxID=2023065 RepID=UPI002D47B02B|nr:ATP-binding cassette domain-containing protein [Stackebrandtia sp.]HZE40528.1 ATP-binding cassette domain-containing protein [Stackebrandtia sp.]
MSTALTFDDITVRYRKTVALRGVSASVAPGELLAVTGASGAGKTTLLWTARGLVAPDSGTVTVQGEPPDDLDDDNRVVLIPQGNGLASVLTARENVAVALLAAGWKPADATARAGELLDELGVGGQTEQLAEELSGGQRQRVAIARGLALRGSIVLADEVTSDLDVDNRDHVLDLLRAEAERGAAVVLATHDSEAAEACDSRLHLKDGLVVDA